MKRFANESRSVLASVAEALVLGFHLDETAAEFEMVCELWAKSSEAERAVGAFRFCGVQQFRRRPGTAEDLRKVGTTFVARAIRGSWVIQAVRSDRVNNIAISLGESFGGVEFRYEDLSHEVIHLYAKAKGPSDWDYFEVGTNRPVDFHNPFGRPWASIE